jgi:hypothetical protein
MTHQCKFCQKSFQKENSLSVHLCEPKLRFQQRSEPGVILAFQGYLKFYEYTQGSARLKTHDDFDRSSYYRAFVKWGRYCVDVRVIAPARFLEWLLKHNKKIDRWCLDTVYTEYLVEYLCVEAVSDALTRAIEYGIQWAEQTGNPAHDCVRYGNRNALCHAVTTGRISAWVIYNSESGQKFLTDLDPTQIKMIWSYIDADMWQKNFADRSGDQAYAQEILVKAGW